MKKLIETALPLKELNNSAIGDKARKGHPGNLHLWWNRSPIGSSEALLRAGMEDDSDDSNRKKQLAELKKIASGEQIGANSGKEKYPTICDPFSGFGGLTIAAQHLGLNVEASDLNAVATLLTKAATEIPALFNDSQPVNPKAENKMYFGSEGLAEDISYYGQQIQNIAQARLSDQYPKINIPGTGDKAEVFSWIWVRTMKCPNPACGCQMPLATSYVLSKSKGQEYWAEPEVVNNRVRFHIHQGICPDEKVTNKHGSKGPKFICPACGQLTRDEDVKRAGQSGKLGTQMMAVCAQTKEGRIYIAPDDLQKKAADLKRPEDVPAGALPNNTRWFSPPGFGMKDYSDLYIPRQLTLMDALCNLVANVSDKVEEDALKAGMPDDKKALTAGGTGAFAYGQAVSVYLALVIGKIANFQSSICTWDNRKGNVRAAFTRQAIPMTWVFAEGNPFFSPTGNYDSMLKNVVDAVAGLHARSGTSVEQKDALNCSFPENSILFTELPYYDNVGYADLSDYFYIWLRKCLKDVYPDLFEKMVTSKDELSSIPEHFAGDAVKGIEEYRSGIRKMLGHFEKSASNEYPSILFFEYGKEDEAAIASDETEGASSAFEDLICSLYESGFAVTGIWPIRTEKANKKFESFRVAVVFRKKKDDLPGTTRRNFINTLKRELPVKLDTAFEAGVDDQDKIVVGLGLGMQTFTEFKRVVNADGSEMNIHDALQLVYQETREYLGAHPEDVQTEEV